MGGLAVASTLIAAIELSIQWNKIPTAAINQVSTAAQLVPLLLVTGRIMVFLYDLRHGVCNGGSRSTGSSSGGSSARSSNRGGGRVSGGNGGVRNSSSIPGPSSFAPPSSPRGGSGTARSPRSVGRMAGTVILERTRLTTYTRPSPTQPQTTRDNPPPDRPAADPLIIHVSPNRPPRPLGPRPIGTPVEPPQTYIRKVEPNA